MTAFLWGIASVFMVEGIVLVFAIDWLRKKAQDEKASE